MVHPITVLTEVENRRTACEEVSTVTLNTNRLSAGNRPPYPGFDTPPPPYSPTDQAQVTVETIAKPILKNHPDVVRCPHCHDRVVTRVIFINTDKTHISAGFLCGFTIWCMLCCLAVLPYYMKTFKTAQHYCPNCNSLIGENQSCC